MSRDIIHIDLSFRCDNLRVSVSNAVTIKAIKEFRANGYEGLINTTVAGLNAQLRPHIETLIAEVAKENQ